MWRNVETFHVRWVVVFLIHQDAIRWRWLFGYLFPERACFGAMKSVALNANIPSCNVDPRCPNHASDFTDQIVRCKKMRERENAMFCAVGKYLFNTALVFLSLIWKFLVQTSCYYAFRIDNNDSPALNLPQGQYVLHTHTHTSEEVLEWACLGCL